MSAIGSRDMTDHRIVIIGGGQVAAQLVGSLRQHGCRSRISLITNEPYLPYQRPPLSKGFLCGETEAEKLHLRGAEFYASAEVSLALSRRAVTIDRTRRRVGLDDGSWVPYDDLVLATGARARRLDLPGINLGGVLSLRSLDDAVVLRRRLLEGPARLVIVGGGYIGLELAASARKMGWDVCVLEAAERVLARVASATVADEIASLHLQHGVRILTAVKVCAIEGAVSAAMLRCADGTAVPADLVVIGAGAQANDELASEAGLLADGGVVVDRTCRTLDPHVYAAGDCACVVDALSGQRQRLESVPNAVTQADIVATQLCGLASPPAVVPWFWSDQHGARLQMAGWRFGQGSVVVRRYGGIEQGLAEFFLRDGHLVAATMINRPQDFMLARRTLALAEPPLLDAAALGDSSIPLAHAFQNYSQASTA